MPLQAIYIPKKSFQAVEYSLELMTGHGGKRPESPIELTYVGNCRGFCWGGCGWKTSHKAGTGGRRAQDPKVWLEVQVVWRISQSQCAYTQ